MSERLTVSKCEKMCTNEQSITQCKAKTKLKHDDCMCETTI